MVHVPFFRILVVEDHQVVRRFICSVVQQKTEFRVIGEASDGLEAIQQARDLQPDLILIDIGLPKLNGIEAARQMRRVAPHAKLVFVSLESFPDVVREAFRLGAHGYVDKQHAPSELLPAIEDVLRGKRYVSTGLVFNERASTRHEVQFCSNDAVLLESATDFLAAALKAGDPALVFATKSHRESLAQKLKERAINIDGAAQRGSFISLDAAKAVSKVVVNGKLDRVRSLQGLKHLVGSASRASEAKYPRVAIFGECAPLLCAAHNIDAAVQLENTVNDIFKTHNVDILCAYSLKVVHPGDQGAYSKVCEEHTAVHSR